MSSTRVVSRVQVNETSWPSRSGLVSGRAGEVGEGQHHLEEGGDGPHGGRDGGVPRGRLTRRAVLVRSGARNAASPSRPTVALAARVLTAETSGTPQRTSGPASARSSGVVAPVSAAATTAARSPAATIEPERSGQPRRGRDRRALGGGHVLQRRYCGRMSLHPPAPSDLGALVDAYAQTVQHIIDIGRTMRPGDEERPTDCPGWTVLDQFAHVASTEAMVAGEPVPDLDVSDHAHVRHAFGERVERYVESRRGRDLEEVLDELEERLEERLRCLPVAAASGPSSPSPAPSATTTAGALLGIRVFDIWMHEQDVREALDRPGGLDIRCRRALASSSCSPRCRASSPRTPAIEPGNAVVLDLTGPTVGRAGARVEEHDGKAVGVPLFTGDAEEHPDVVTTSLTMSTAVAGRLAGGRRSPDELHVVVHGDDDVARRVMSAMVITP